MSVWFTSDTHFGHANVIGYCNRPFKDVETMNAELTKRWNEVVAPDDTIYHLGDFSMGPSIRRPEYVKGLNGYKILILGNHDASRHKMLAAGFNEVLEIGQYNGWTLIHVPLGMTGNVLCGHVHEKWLRHKDATKDIINVGVDQWNFRPVSFETLMGAFVS